MKETILVISGQVVSKNAKVNYPDLNFPNSGDTVLRTVHSIDFDAHSFQLDGEDGPVYSHPNLPKNVGFYTNLEKVPTKTAKTK
jgi:hypothetical protein